MKVSMILNTATVLIFISLVNGQPTSRIISKITNAENSDAYEQTERFKRNIGFPRILRFSQQLPTSLTVISGSNHVLECEAGGFPAPIVYWMKNGERLYQNQYESDAEMERLLMIKSKLYLDCITSDDVGDYTCVAENIDKKITTNVNIEVLEGDDEDICAEQNALGSAARINLWTTKMLTLQGTNAHLYCRTEGLPKPKVTWFDPDKNHIKDNYKYEISDNGDLIIYNVAWEDLGNYRCLSENDRGIDIVDEFLYPVAPSTEGT